MQEKRSKLTTITATWYVNGLARTADDSSRTSQYGYDSSGHPSVFNSVNDSGGYADLLTTYS